MKYRHIYETPEIYDMVYGRPNHYKLAEAQAFTDIMQMKGITKGKLLELFSGRESYHKQHALSFLPALDYWCSDRVSAKGEQVIAVKDLVTDDWGHNFDLVVAYFYSMSSIIDFKDGYVKKHRVIHLLANVLKHLKRGGTFIIDSCPESMTAALGEDMVGAQSTVTIAHPSSKLWRMLKAANRIKGPEEVRVEASFVSHYDRVRANNVDVFKHVKVYINGRLYKTYTYELPFCQRYFSEPEIREMFAAAGFKKVESWHAYYSTSYVKKLDDIVKSYALPFEATDAHEAARTNVWVAH